MWSRGEEREPRQAVSLDRHSTSAPERQRYFIDGPARLTSALQLISSAIGASAASAAASVPPAAPHPPSPAPPPNHPHPHGALVLTAVSRSRSEERVTPASALSAAIAAESEADFDNEDSLEEAPTSIGYGSSPPSPGPRTIVASDGEVSNGFVKDGQRLPYVFEASDSGARKRTSKILPVCGVCGKRFVCVTTMKRHLVTHTGEKPFSCKVCGKQYTQKGNLRVHERTHRNDRPFECNICHQKFYRKEPMQKHQWRQHGVVHFKARPHPAGINTTGPPTAPLVLPDGPAPAESALAPPVNVLYNSIVDRIKYNSLETRGESSRHLDGSPEIMLPPPAPRQPPPTRPPSSPQSGPEDLSNHHRADLAADGSEEPEDDDGVAPEIGHPVFPSSSDPSLGAPPSSDADLSTPLPTPLNAKLLTTLPPPPPPPPPPSLPTEPASAVATVVDDDDDEHRPIKLKKLLAHAYQKEVEEAEHQSQSHLQHDPTPLPAPLSLPQDDFPTSSEESLSNSNNQDSSAATQQEMVECQCKACGHVFSVLDPYNFRCSNCNVKYTSLPTHMIADPLQCIGCCQVFPHKPALKAHQMGISDASGIAGAIGGERPFRCCKCGYGFRQKAHLQKHQWRIHRRKLEPDPSVKEAEALMHAIKGIPPPLATQQQPSEPPAPLNDGKIATITIQEIIDRGVERSMGRPFLAAPSSSSSASSASAAPSASAPSSAGGMQPLDLSPTKSITPLGNRDDPKLTDLVAAMPPLGPSATGRPPPLMSSLPMLPPTPREPNPLFSQLPLQLPTEPVRISAAALGQPDSSPSSPSTKRQRTLDAPPPSASASSSSSASPSTMHRSLPPITSLQRPPTSTATMTSNWAAANRAHRAPDTKDPTRVNASDLAKKDLFIRGQLQHGLRTQQHEQSDVRTV